MPETCETCPHLRMRDRHENFGDVVEPWCERTRRWLDYYEDRPAPCLNSHKKTR